ncbi:MAG: hypothetical protein AABX11_07320 [Nanoarchaeota archaeon]
MSEIKIPRINQNILVLVISLVALYFSELNNLKTMYLISVIMSMIIGVQVIISMVFYTYDYVKGKLWNARWSNRLLKEDTELRNI